ncbi:MAG TPA: hypothetical protein PLR12_00705 [Clostridia bacterium]|jgi:hypothetical protein|nr:hypothetical protein [Clostridia bacterium]HPY93921.1 hypothetical protein [Clostridia bacterium]HQO55999.1 hypothetical protein [Clostridia bacterium]
MLKIVYLGIVALCLALIVVNMFRKKKNIHYQIEAALVLVPLILRLLLIK